jgi:hypothetical protein
METTHQLLQLDKWRQIVDKRCSVRQKKTFLEVLLQILFGLTKLLNMAMVRYVEVMLGQMLNHLCTCEISSSHGGEYDVQNCLLGCTDVSELRTASIIRDECPDDGGIPHL